MIDRFPAAILSACLILTSATARADPPWGHGGHDRRGGERGHGHMRDWRRGEYYVNWRSRQWRGRDWRRYHGLWAPPSGYYWMQSGAQYLLVAAVTGLIAGVVAATTGVAMPVPVVPVVPAYPTAPYPAAPAYTPPY